MTHSSSRLFDALCEPANLDAAYRRLSTAGGLWRRGVPMFKMRHQPVRHMLELARDLVARRYQPDVPRAFEIEKGDGTRRTLHAYSVRDRIVQRAALHVLQPAGERLFLDFSYGFRPGLTVDMAVSRVREFVRAGYHWLVDGDIRRCFDAIPRPRVVKLVQAVAGDREFVRLISAWLSTAPTLNARGEACGLPQGMVLSPFLCNLYLHGFDLALRRADIPAVRYADDFVMLARSQRDAHAARGFARERLAGAGLELHPDKTRVIKSARTHAFLGRRLPEATAFGRSLQCC